MTAQPLTADPTPNPDPNQDRAAADSRARTARLRGVLGKLIRLGQELVQQVNRPAALFWIAVRFGTKDAALIRARIIRGLRLAAALQATLPKYRQPPQPPRPARPAPVARKPRTQPAPRPPKHPDSVLASLPTSKEIAEQLRHRPVGDVLAEICRELGMITTSPFWQALKSVIVENGGDPDSVVDDSENRIAFSTKNFFPPDTWQFQPAQSAPRFADPAPAATGPPE